MKELFLAIILGALLGFGITGGFLAVQNSKKGKTITSTISVSPTTDPSAVLTPTTNDIPTPISANSQITASTGQVTIDSPKNNDVVANTKVTLKGSAVAQSTLVITTPIKTYYTQADNAGNFNIDIDVDSGVNRVQVDAIDPQENQTTAQILVTYSTAKF